MVADDPAVPADERNARLLRFARSKSFGRGYGQQSVIAAVKPVRVQHVVEFSGRAAAVRCQGVGDQGTEDELQLALGDAGELGAEVVAQVGPAEFKELA